MTRNKSILFWILSVVMMMIIIFYQRATGPTYPTKCKVTINSQDYKLELPRTHGGAGNEVIALNIPDVSVSGKITLKRFKSNDNWVTTDMKRDGNFLKAEIPHQASAGKIIYSISLLSANNENKSLTNEPVVIRFRSDVPMVVVVFHLIFLFSSILFSIRTGFEAIYKGVQTNKLALITCITLFIGGIIIGPIMQKYAFDAWWTGFPFGHDMTDNKTAIALLAWVVAYWRLRKNPNAYKWAIGAAIIMLVVFLIPHSVLGSEIDYTKMPQQ